MTQTETSLEVPSKVIIKQFRKIGWVDAAPDAEYQLSNTATVLSVQRDRTTGIMNTGLTKEDEVRLEGVLGLTSGTLSKTSNYWDQDNFNIRFTKEGITLYPRTKALDEIKWRVMLEHSWIANSEKTRTDWPFAWYVMTSEEEQTRETNKSINVKAEAFKEFLSMSEQSLKDFLVAYGKNPGNNASLEFIKAQVGKVVDTEPDTFLSLVKSVDYKYKVFLKKLIDKGIVRENGGKYTLIGGEVLGFSFDQAIDFLQKEQNQEVLVSLKGQLQAAK
jgi:hypothetical protein